MIPRRPGYFLFDGTRYVGGNNQYKSVCEPVQVIEIMRTPKDRELAVKLIGRQQAFPLTNFEGIWKPIAIKENVRVDE